MELYQYTASALIKLMKEGKCSSVEITTSVLDQIKKTDEKIGAYITVTADEALKSAENIDKKRANGDVLPALAGIPIGIKDNICTKGLLTTCASKILYNFVPPYNATVAEKVNDANLVVTGKLNMDEFAMGSSCETSHFKLTRNPFNLDAVPGGSSGGSAAAVASGEAVISLGSDTGGSIRQPAACCGVVGLKPTYGAVSRFGLVAFASSLDQIGPFGRCIDDVALLSDVIMGHDSMDATSVNREYKSIAPSLNADVKGMRIALPKEYFGDGIDAEVKESVMKAAKVLEQQGAILTEISLPSTDYALSAYYIISSAEASSNLARFDGVKYGYRTEDFSNLLDLYEKTRSEGFGKEVKRRIMLGTFVLSSGYYDAYYKRAKLTQQKIAQEFEDAFKSVDAILTPVMPTTAFKIGERANDPLKMYAADVCTVPVNIAGLPALVQPCGMDKNGLPIGMQLIGAKFSESTLLNIGKAYENVAGGFAGIPQI